MCDKHSSRMIAKAVGRRNNEYAEFCTVHTEESQRPFFAAKEVNV